MADAVNAKGFEEGHKVQIRAGARIKLGHVVAVSEGGVTVALDSGGLRTFTNSSVEFDPSIYEAKRGRCPDNGACYHGCRVLGPCYRVLACGPLSNVFVGDTWPANVYGESGVKYALFGWSGERDADPDLVAAYRERYQEKREEQEASMRAALESQRPAGAA